jgi:hypothetical protein
MTESLAADQPIAYYQLPEVIGDIPGDAPADILRVAEIVPAYADAQSLGICAAGVADVVRDSWVAKFVDTGVLRDYEVANVVKNASQQEQAFARRNPRNPRHIAARYFVTSTTGYSPITRPDDVRAVLRVEQYRPQMPRRGNWNRRPYPNVTDIETRNGMLAKGEYHLDALALMRVALREAHPSHAVAAYTERENPDGLTFLHGIGFADRRRDQAVTVGQQPTAEGPAVRKVIRYVHMEAPRAQPVNDALRQLVDPHTAD